MGQEWDDGRKSRKRSEPVACIGEYYRTYGEDGRRAMDLIRWQWVTVCAGVTMTCMGTSGNVNGIFIVSSLSYALDPRQVPIASELFPPASTIQTTRGRRLSLFPLP